ncbi:YceI family protein [Flavobacterium sp. JP2137]|uniref:YceI family protein n=1 Tax=Flavobacterium sp. JP2137 TaxID=3414510 RepID=UPI003D2F9CB1
MDTDTIESTETSKDAVNYAIAATDSKVEWTGSKLTGGKHNGTINVSNGEINVKDGKIENGKVVFDMTSISVEDLKAGDGKEDLEAHLKGTGKEEASDHFFNVNKYPQGTFEITAVTEENGESIVSGNLTLKDVTKAVKFPAMITVSENEVMIHANEFPINRTEWNVNYNSNSVFDNLGDKAINDEVLVKLHIKATK